MRMEIVLGDGDRVDAITRRSTIHTDQDGSYPAPFELFLASIGTCAGIYVSKFCRQRGLSPEDIRIVQTTVKDEDSGLIGRVDLDIQLPEGFPEKYRSAVVRAAGLCAVKKHLATPPDIEVKTSTAVPTGEATS